MKRFGILNQNGKEILFMAVGGSFASEAWMKSDEEYQRILGQSFSAITADDGKNWNIGRNIRRCTQEEYSRLFKDSHPAFKLKVELHSLQVKGLSAKLDSIWFLDNVDELLKEYSAEEIKEYYINKYC